MTPPLTGPLSHIDRTIPPLNMQEEVLSGRIPNPPHNPNPVSPLYRVKGRAAILSCTECELRAGCRAPVPWFGPAPNLALVVGEAPGASEDRQGRPFVGVSGQLLKNSIRQLGMDPDILTYSNTVACLPNYKPPTPRTEHMEACAHHLARTIRIISPAHILLVGAVALSRFRGDLRISTAHGRPFVIPNPSSPASRAAGLWIMPLTHPAAILRDNTQRASWLEDLALWLALITEPTWPSRYLPITCAVCRHEVHRYDPDGVAWCTTHYSKGYAGWQAAVKKRKWLSKAGAVDQGEIAAGMREAMTAEVRTNRTDPSGGA